MRTFKRKTKPLEIDDIAIVDYEKTKKEVKAIVSGIYIIGVKGLHGSVKAPEQKKKSFWKRTVDKIQEKGGAKPLM